MVRGYKVIHRSMISLDHRFNPGINEREALFHFFKDIRNLLRYWVKDSLIWEISVPEDVEVKQVKKDLFFTPKIILETPHFIHSEYIWREALPYIDHRAVLWAKRNGLTEVIETLAKLGITA